MFNLEAEGYRVDVAYSAEEALTLNLPENNLILLDIMMGEISGTQMAKILKAKEDTANIPIISSDFTHSCSRPSPAATANIVSRSKRNRRRSASKSNLPIM